MEENKFIVDGNMIFVNNICSKINFFFSFLCNKRRNVKTIKDHVRVPLFIGKTTNSRYSKITSSFF